jgi:hypothetical protein
MGSTVAETCLASQDEPDLRRHSGSADTRFERSDERVSHSPKMSDKWDTNNNQSIIESLLSLAAVVVTRWLLLPTWTPEHKGRRARVVGVQSQCHLDTRRWQLHFTVCCQNCLGLRCQFAAAAAGCLLLLLAHRPGAGR